MRIVGVLEWILILEVVTLGLAALFGLASLYMARNDPNDPIYLFSCAFWRELLWPPAVMDFDAPYRPPPVHSPSAQSRTDDEAYGRIKRDKDGRIASAILTVLVVPHSPADKVVGAVEGGLKIEVTGESGDGRANKAITELVSQAIGVKPYQVAITKGHYQSQKAVTIQGIRPDELETKLAQFA
jgi:uncharacterized protein YggU (UPF0235/DUF167 family)